MKKKKVKVKKKNRLLNEKEKDIGDLIDDMAYIDENHSIKKSKRFLDNMYRLNDEE